MSVIAENVDPININQIFNSPDKNVGHLPKGALIETVALENFGLDQGEYCADPACLSDVTSANEICGLILHECSTGKMIDYQIPAHGISCDDNGKIIVTLDCWKVDEQCSDNEESDLLPFLHLQDNPCEALKLVEAMILQVATKQQVVSWAFGGKSVTIRQPKSDDLYKLRCLYESRCREQVSRETGCPMPVNAFKFTPSC